MFDILKYSQQQRLQFVMYYILRVVVVQLIKDQIQYEF